VFYSNDSQLVQDISAIYTILKAIKVVGKGRFQGQLLEKLET